MKVSLNNKTSLISPIVSVVKNQNQQKIDSINQQMIDFLLNSIRDLIVKNSIIINWRGWNYNLSDPEIEEDAILVRTVITDILDENENKKDLKIDEILELCEIFYEIIRNLLEEIWPNEEKSAFVLYTLSFILKMSKDEFNKEDILNNYDCKYRNESLLKAKEFLAFSFSLSNFTKNILIKISEYSNYFENFPIFIEETKKILTKMEKDLAEKGKIETFLWTDFYETSISALDENWKVLWIIDKENSDRLLKILFIRVLLFQYIKTLDKDNIQVPFLDILIDVLKKELAWFYDTMENFWENILFLLTWKNIDVDVKEKYEESKLHKYVILSIEQEKRKKVLSICLIKANFFLNKDKIPFQKLFDFIKLQDDEKLSKIEDFLNKHIKINFDESDIIFILQNDLEDFDFKKEALTNDLKFIKKLIDIHKVKGDYIVSLNRKTFEIMKQSWNNVDFILKNWVEKYPECKKQKEKLEEDKKYVHSSSPFYKKIEILIEEEYLNPENFSQSYRDLYSDEEFLKSLNFNKKLVWVNNEKTDILNSFYELFEEVENDNKYAFIEEVFLQSLPNIHFLYGILISSKWMLNNLNFHYSSLIWKINTIIKNKNIFTEAKTEQDIIDWIQLCIDDWENLQKEEKNNNEETQIKKYFIELYWEWWKKVLDEKNLSPQEIDELNNIWEFTEEKNKTALIKYIKKNKKINIKWLYSLLSFFSNFWITNFTNFSKIIIFTNQDKIEKNIKYLFQVFSKYNIVNGEREKFKWMVLRYIKNNDQEIIDTYLEKEKLEEIEPKNNYDNWLKKIIENDDMVSIEKLWKKIEKMINMISQNFTPHKTSSTINPHTWNWSWGFTKILHNHFINVLKKKENESYKNYLERIKLFSWIENNISINEESDFTYKKMRQVIVSFKKYETRYYLFDWLSKVYGILEDLDKNTKEKINLNELKKIYRNLLDGEFWKFKDIFWDFEQLEISPQKKNS